MRLRVFLAMTAVLLLQLEACAWWFPQQGAPLPKAQTGEQPPHEPEPPPPPPPRKPPVPVAAPAQAPQTPPEEIAKAVAEPLPPVADPNDLIGLDQPQTEALLGLPSERSEAAPGRIWRYAGRNCELEIYFYLDLKSQVMRALHYEVKSHDPAEPTRDRCFADLVAKHEADVGAPSANPSR